MVGFEFIGEVVIPTEFFSSLDSTSLEVQRQMKSGRPLPFAIHSQKQTQGKGSHGRIWNSGNGNISLSIAVPGFKTWAPSLQVGVICCEWLQQFGIVVRLKWPNDIVYRGSKLGGILCESESSGLEQGPLVIGIGINVLKSEQPQFPHTTCLEDLGWDVRKSIHEVIPDFLQFFKNRFGRVTLEDYLKFTISIHQSVQYHTEHDFIYDITEYGALQGEDRIYYSSEGLTWNYLATNPLPMCVLDSDSEQIRFYHSPLSSDFESKNITTQPPLKGWPLYVTKLSYERKFDSKWRMICIKDQKELDIKTLRNKVLGVE